MTNHEIALVKKSWSILQKIDPAIVADVFYSKLFSDKPALRRMFPARMDQQYRKLIDMLSVIIARLDRLEELTADMEAMARRHVGYGVKEQHYKLVGTALLWTLQKGLGADWNAELHDAWISCYNKLSGVMINASQKETL
jgi:nitric oxide dioxygenase